MSTKKHTSLYFREGSSDKVYNVSLDDDGGTYSVNFSYGRRGSSLTHGTKGKGLHLSKAEAIFDKLVREKTGKGYVEDPSGKPYSAPAKVDTQDLGIRPQLLNDIPEDDVEKYINDPDYCAQEKYDGRRRLLVKDSSGNKAANRKGLIVPLMTDLDIALEKELAAGNYVLDGEDMGDHVMLFDILTPDIGYKERYNSLKYVMKNSSMAALKLADVAWTTEEKRILYNRLKEENAEGIVFKNIHGRYSPGRPNSGGDQLKFKFYATASCIVTGQNSSKRSISVSVVEDGTNNMIPVGNVTVYPNQEIPEMLTIVEVKYLYYFPGGSLFQPILLGVRDDINIDDCGVSKLKAKRGELEEAEA